jgi:hypothetical protein
MLTVMIVKFWTALDQSRDSSAAAVCLFSLLGLAASLAVAVLD